MTNQPAFYDRWLFESPWTAMALAAATALVLLLAGRRSGSRTLLGCAAGAALLAPALYLLASWVTTDREVIARETRLMLRATEAPLDISAFADRFAHGASLAYADGTTWWDAPVMIDRAEAYLRRQPVQRHSINRLDVIPRPPRFAVVELDLTTAAANGMRLNSLWELTFELQNDARWLIQRVRCVRLHGLSAQPGRLRGIQ